MAQQPSGNGLARAKELYENRDRRARELKSEGKKVIGYFCCNVPATEMITAAGFVPYRIRGSCLEPITTTDTHLEITICPFVRSAFDLAVKGRYDFLDGLITPHSCDNIEKIHIIWKQMFNPEYAHYVNVPHVIRGSSYQFFKEECFLLKRSLEEFLGHEISDESLRHAIQLHNENRALVRELYEFSKSDPPLISGVERAQVLLAGMGLPVEEFNDLLRSVIKEVPERRDGPQQKAARLLLAGAEIENVGYIELIEDCGANVVIDDLCTGTRPYWFEVPMTEDPLEGLSKTYLDDINCLRVHQRITSDVRYGHIKVFARNWKANGVFFYNINFCDIQGYSIPQLREYMEEGEGIPFAHVEDDFSLAIGPLRTRVQAFVEMIASRAAVGA